MPMLERLRPSDTTPAVPVTPKRSPNQEGVPAAPVKKSASRRRPLDDRGVVIWQQQKGQTEPQDPFLSSLVTSNCHSNGPVNQALKQEPADAPLPSSLPTTTAHQAAFPSLGEQSEPSQSLLPSVEIADFGESVQRRQEPQSSAIRELNLLKLRVGRLERNERHLRKQLRTRMEQLKDTRVVAEEAQAALIASEERASNFDASSKELRAQVDRYQGWWLTEYHSLKVVLSRTPPHERQEFKHIASAAKARFVTYCSDL